MSRRPLTPYIPAIISGILYFLSFPPFPLGFLAPIALGLFLWDALRAPTAGQAFLRCFIAGAVFNAGLLYWIPRLLQQGLIVVLLSGMVLLIAYLSLWPGLVGLLTRLLARRGQGFAVAAFPFLWVGQEKLRELGEMSFPWVIAGYSYGNYTRLIQYLSVGGVYFYSLLIAATAAVLVLAWRWRQAPIRLAILLAALLLVHGGLYFYGGRRIAHTLLGPPDKIAVVQPNVDQNVKWDHRFTDSVYTLLRTLSVQAAGEDPDLIVWPESAMPCYFLKRSDFVSGISSLSDSLNIPFLLGSLDYTVSHKGREMKPHYYNSSFFHAPGTAGFDKYDKINLVPFSERLPFDNVIPLISRVDLGEADFTAGDSLKLFPLKGRRFFTPICYEVVYPDPMRAFARAGGNLMVHITNDGWFGRSGMPFQHFNITRFRAVETGIPVARCANTGVSGFIDPFGRASGVTAIYTSAVTTGELPPALPPTPYSVHGDVAGWLSLWTALLVGLGLAGETIFFKIKRKKGV